MVSTFPTTVLGEGFCQRVSKPWGYELLTTPPDLPYAGKLLFVTAGRRLSLQSHDEKTETMTLLSGRAVLLLEDAFGNLREEEMRTHSGYSIRAGQRHRLSALTDALVAECSTPESGITLRFEDDYGRGDETQAERGRRNTD
jgi:mannose-6-phosphate isomerase-like protein (cupin superfamily)